MLILITSTAASSLSIVASIAAAYHRWGVVLVMQIVCGVAWLIAEGAIMAELEDPIKMAPCLLPAVGQVFAGAVGCFRYYVRRHSAVAK